MTASCFGKSGIYAALLALALMAMATAALAPSWAQSPEPAGSVPFQGTVQGHVRDSRGRPVPDATVFLQSATAMQAAASIQITHTDSGGAYRFAALREGTYTLRAEINGGQATSGPVVVADVLANKSLVDNGEAAEAVPYLLRASQLNPKDPEVHHLLGNVEEQFGNPLEAVREYQRAAELDPSEPNLFDWGTELLTHRALEPATEVFTKGNRLFPKSVRMLVALGVAWYARGSYDQATRCLVKASDLAPDNLTPYLFLGKMQSVETTPSEGSVERLARFAQMRPDNALANYYYAVSLSKQSGKQSAGASD